MNSGRETNRREVIATIAGGTVLGGIWGASFPKLTMKTQPSLSVIGHHHAQLVLIDSTAGRALVLVGEPDDVLIARLPAVMTMFRQRIDLIIGSRSVLAVRAAQLRDRWSIRHAVSLQSAAVVETLAMPTSGVTDRAAVGLGGGLSLECLVGHRNEWQAQIVPDSTALWSLTLNHSGGSTVISPDIASMTATVTSPSLLIISPDVPPLGTVQRLPTQAIAANYDGETKAELDAGLGSLIRIYPEDIARFTLHDGGIDLPAWTEYL